MDVQYMMHRSLMLLLSDIGPGRSNYQDSVGFRPGYRGDDFSGQPVFLCLILLMNVWMALSNLCMRLLPRLSLPCSWVQGGEGKVTAVAQGSIDWGETFRHWQTGGEGYVERRPRRAVKVKHAEYVAFVLGEVVCHAEVICAAVTKLRYGRQASPIQRIVKDVASMARRVARFRENEFSGFGGTYEHLLSRGKSVLVGVLSDPHASVASFRLYDSKLDAPAPVGSFVASALDDLVKWRRQYLSCSVWVEDGAGFTLQRRRATERLYEMWCFSEICLAVGRLGLGDVLQRNFIARSRLGPQFVMAESRYVFFDQRVRQFRSPTWEMNRMLFESGLLRPAFPDAHVEWFVLNPERFEESVVLDTKYSGWNSREALKVLGYMLNYGVRRGIVIFGRDLDFSRLGGKEVGMSLHRVECPGASRSFLWVAYLVPDASRETENGVVADRLVSEALLDDVS